MRAFRSLYFAVCVLVLSTGVGLYVDLKNHALQERHLAISTGLECMLRLNHQLNSMVILSVLEQNTLRTASHDISAANRDLEEKVRLRTSELEEVNRKLEDLSSTDALTGLANRRRFDAVWELEWQRALRQGFPLAIAMIDVDHFKDYNDHCGHQAGDDCLQRLAQVLAAATQRSGELAARYGGEEFVIVLPGVNPEDAIANAERIRSAVEALNIVNSMASPAGTLTVSIGVASRVPTASDSPDHLLRAADAALYEAKHQGRNRVCFAA